MNNTSAGINSFALNRGESRTFITGGYDFAMGSYDNRIAVGGDQVVTEGPSCNESSTPILP